MKSIKVFLILIFLGTGISLARAQATGTVIGEGARTCKSYAKSSGKKENEFIIWVQGFFSAFNTLVPGIGNVTKGHDFFWIKDWLKTYCKAHPEQYFNDAVQALLQELHPGEVKISQEPLVKP